MSIEPRIGSLPSQPRCALFQRHHGPCRGEIQWHHVVKQQRITHKFANGAYLIRDSHIWQPIPRYGVDYVRAHGWDVAATITLDLILADGRNRMWLCTEGHHEPVTNGRIHPKVPDSVWEFAREYGMVADLENDLARQRG